MSRISIMTVSILKLKSKNNTVFILLNQLYFNLLFDMACFFFCLRNGLVQDVCTHVGTENNVPAWIVLYCLSTQMQFKKPLFVVEYYQRNVVSHEVSTDSKWSPTYRGLENLSLR